MMRDYGRLAALFTADELIRLRDGSSHLNYAIYHDWYQRTPDGWRFSERSYEIRYLDTTALAGSAPRTADSAPRVAGSAPQAATDALTPETR